MNLGCSARSQIEKLDGSNIWNQVTNADGKEQNAKSVGSAEGSQDRKSVRKQMKSEPDQTKPRQVAAAAVYLEPMPQVETKRWKDGS